KRPGMLVAESTCRRFATPRQSAKIRAVEPSCEEFRTFLYTTRTRVGGIRLDFKNRRAFQTPGDRHSPSRPRLRIRYESTRALGCGGLNKGPGRSAERRR